MKMVTATEVESAQNAWGEGIVAIAHAHSTGGDYVSIARNHVESLYAYGLTEVLSNRHWLLLSSSDQTLRVHYHIL